MMATKSTREHDHTACCSLQLNVIYVAYTVTVLEGTTVPVIMAGVVHVVTKVGMLHGTG